MFNLLEDFLNREERRRNRSLSKRFRTWLSSERGETHVKKLHQILSKPGGEDKAVQLIRRAEEAYKADDTHRKQDAKRKKSLKIFRDAFELWLKSNKGAAYQTQIDEADTEEKSEAALLDAEKAFARANPHLLPDDYKDGSKTRIRPVRFARSRDVEDLSFDVIEPGLNQMGLVGSNIVRNWANIVGNALAENTRPERVTFPPKGRSHGTLYIMARQGFNTIIQHHTQEIIFRINSHFGFAAVSEVRISKRYFIEMETTGQRIARKVISSRVTPAAKLDTGMSKLIENVEDPDFKQAFEELGKLIKARNG